MRRMTLALLVAAFVALAAAPARAKDPDDQIVITGTVDVPAGKTVGDVVIVDGPVTIAGAVHGDVVSVTGRVTISGTVRGDVTAFHKRVVLTPTARISGDLLYADKRPVVPPGAVVMLVTLVGIPLGLGVLLALLPLGALCYVVSAYVLGRRLVKPPTGRIPAFLAGWGILRGAALVPFLGALTWFAATVFGLGVLVVALWRARG